MSHRFRMLNSQYIKRTARGRIVENAQAIIRVLTHIRYGLIELPKVIPCDTRLDHGGLPRRHYADHGRIRRAVFLKYDRLSRVLARRIMLLDPGGAPIVRFAPAVLGAAGIHMEGAVVDG